MSREKDIKNEILARSQQDLPYVYIAKQIVKLRKLLTMKKGTLTNFFEKTGTYVRMTPVEQNRVQKKTQMVSKIKPVKKKK